MNTVIKALKTKRVYSYLVLLSCLAGFFALDLFGLEIQATLERKHDRTAGFKVSTKNAGFLEKEYWISANGCGLTPASITAKIKNEKGTKVLTLDSELESGKKPVPSDTPYISYCTNTSRGAGVLARLKPEQVIWNFVEIKNLDRGDNEIVFIVDEKYASQPISFKIE